MLRPLERRRSRNLATSFFRALQAASCTILVAVSAQAKDPGLTAIALFDNPSGAAYVQISGVMLNGKTELRNCNGASKITRSNYGKLSKIQLRGASSLEENADGELVLTGDRGPICVVPSNLRFEKNVELTPQELAKQATLQGTVVSSSANQGPELPALKPGVRLVFVSAPDTELAEYLRAQRARSTVVWQDFLTRYFSSSRVSDAKKALAGLFQESGESHLAEYRKSVAARAPDLAHLKQAQQQAEQAINTVQGNPAALQLLEQVRGEIAALTEADQAELQAYRKALVDHAPGYARLVATKRHIDQVIDASPKYSPALALQIDLVKELTSVEGALQTAEALLTSNRYDEAFGALGAYRFFVSEVPRIDAVVTAVYVFHFRRGEQFSGQQNWEGAVAEFRKAVAARSDRQEAAVALRNAEMQLVNTRDRAAADSAIEQSKSYVAQKQYIEAYEVLANLLEPQHTLVADQLDALKPDYVAAAFQRAQSLQEVHLPIRGRADEEAVRRAYDLLARASDLSDDQAIKLKRDLLSDKISDYYVEQAKRYLEKPMASGVGLGWFYLAEAERYKENLEVVKDQRTRYESAYQLRAKLSMGVVFRDQTSRRQSVGFADQLADAIATNLESLGLPVKVVHQASETANAVQPNFLLVGEINEHRTVRNPTVETLQSKYRASTREVKNEAWLKANREYEAAQQDLSSLQHALDLAVASKKKKEIAAAMNAVLAGQKRVEEAHVALDAIDQTRPQEVIEPYNYTKRTVDLTAVIELAFRISDQAGNPIEPTARMKHDNHKVYVLLENVKPEDREGVKEQGVAPDEIQFMTDLEIEAQDILIKSVRDKVSHLPAKILQEARKRAQKDDLDRAAEQYILYLNATPDVASPEREEATRFLREHFNVGAGKAS